MARTEKRSKPLATFKHPLRVEVRRPKFELFSSVRQLDVAKLARAARAEFEVGSFGNGRCRQLVRAVVRKGKVIGLVAEPCPGDRPERASPELTRLLNAARRRAAPRARPGKLRVPVAEFLSQAQALTVRTITCVEICFLGVCFYCCNRPDDPDEWVCGEKVVILNPTF